MALPGAGGSSGESCRKLSATAAPGTTCLPSPSRVLVSKCAGVSGTCPVGCHPGRGPAHRKHLAPCLAWGSSRDTSHPHAGCHVGEACLPLHAYAHTLTHMHSCTHAHTRTHARTHSRTHAHTRSHTYTHAHTCTYTHAHTLMHTHSFTHTHTHGGYHSIGAPHWGSLPVCFSSLTV